MDTTIKMVLTPEDEDEVVFALQDTSYAGLDIETTTHPWYDPDFRILTIAVSTRPGHAYVFPVQHPHSVSRPFAFGSVLKRLPQEPSWIMQNGQFDYVALQTLGIKLDTPWFDTMVASYLLDVDAPKGLTVLAQRWLGRAPWKDIDYKHPEQEDLTVLARLNGRDADITRQLYEPLSEALQKAGQTLLFDELMMPACITLSHMEIDGVPVLQDKLADLIEKTEEEADRLLNYLQRIAGNDKFNPNSHKQVRELLYEQLGLPVTVWTDSGVPSSNAEALANIQKTHSVVPVLQEFRAVRKLLTASLRPWQDKADENGWLHPRYKPAQARTGRLSSEMPNIQQVPRRKDVRGVFGHPELSILEADYSQLELRIVAWLSGEPTMLAAFRNGDDLHQVTADKFGVDRQTAKSLNFGLLYGAGPRKLRQVAKTDYGVELSEIQAEALRLQWFTTYSSVQEFHDNIIEEAKAEGGSGTAFGRWRPLPDIHSPDHPKRGHAERQAMNTPIQSPASDITLMKLIELYNDPYLQQLDVRPMATVHDSILFLGKPGNVRVAEPYVKARMEDMTIFDDVFGVTVDVPLVVDTKIGDCWGEG